MIVYLNEKFVEEEYAHISIWDAGFLHGDGVFTTMRLYQGHAPDLEAHWQRLSQQAQALAIPFPLTIEEMKGIAAHLVHQNGIRKTDARLRITVTPGGDPENALPITPGNDQRPTVLMTTSPLPASIDLAGEQGIAVIALGPEFKRSHFPRLKSLNNLPSLRALREARSRGCTEAVIMDQDGFLTEGAVSNIFLVKEGKLFTPADNGAILAGHTRRRIIALANQFGLPCREMNLTRLDLEKADEVFLCNSIRQVVPVIRIDDQQLGDGRPGPTTRRIRSWYDTAIRKK